MLLYIKIIINILQMFSTFIVAISTFDFLEFKKTVKNISYTSVKNLLKNTNQTVSSIKIKLFLYWIPILFLVCILLFYSGVVHIFAFALILILILYIIFFVLMIASALQAVQSLPKKVRNFFNLDYFLSLVVGEIFIGNIIPYCQDFILALDIWATIVQWKILPTSDVTYLYLISFIAGFTLVSLPIIIKILVTTLFALPIYLLFFFKCLKKK